jgi:hypothetical protein
MKENRLWKALLWGIKHGFTDHPKVKKKLRDLDTSSLIHYKKKLKNELSAKEMEAVSISPTKTNNEQWQIL